MGWDWASKCVICGRDRSGLMSAWGYLPGNKNRGLRPMCGACRQDMNDKKDKLDARSDLVRNMEKICRPLLGRIEESISTVRGYRNEHRRVADGRCICDLCAAADKLIGG